MKNKISILLSSLFVLFIYTGCEDDSELFTATQTNPVTLSELALNMIELDAVNTNNPAATFSWSVADYGQPAEERYALEVSSDEAFTNPIVPSTVNGNNTVTLSMGELNSAAGNAGLNPLAWGTLYARIVSTLGSQGGLSVPSNVISFEVFPFFNYPFNDFYLVGNGTSADWNNNNNNPPLFRDADNSNFYTYTGFFTKGSGTFNDGRFKIIETRGLWQPQWGTTTNEGDDVIVTAGAIASNPITQDGDPGRFGVPTDGFFTFTIDFANRTYTTNPFDASSATDFTSMALQGSALGAETALTQSSFDSHLWYSTSVRLLPGDLQFKTNTGSTWAGTTSFSGVATEGSNAVPVIVEDDYEVWFNDLTGDYIMIPLNL